jgi:hypothetical protein
VKVAFGSHALGLLRLIDCTDARSVQEFTPLIWFGASLCNANLKINSVGRFNLRVSYEDCPNQVVLIILSIVRMYVYVILHCLSHIRCRDIVYLLSSILILMHHVPSLGINQETEGLNTMTSNQEG